MKKYIHAPLDESGSRFIRVVYDCHPDTNKPDYVSAEAYVYTMQSPKNTFEPRESQFLLALMLIPGGHYDPRTNRWPSGISFESRGEYCNFSSSNQRNEAKKKVKNIIGDSFDVLFLNKKGKGIIFLAPYGIQSSDTDPLETCAPSTVDHKTVELANEDDIVRLDNSLQRTTSAETNFARPLPHLKPTKYSERPIFVAEARADVFDALDKAFDSSNVVFLHGIGGIGKSEAAKRWATSRSERFDTVVFAQLNPTVGRSNITLLINDDLLFVLGGSFENKKTVPQVPVRKKQNRNTLSVSFPLSNR